MFKQVMNYKEQTKKLKIFKREFKKVICTQKIFISLFRTQWAWIIASQIQLIEWLNISFKGYSLESSRFIKLRDRLP